MLDAHQILAQLDAGGAPPPWQVLRVRTGYLVGRVFAGIFGTLVGGAGAGFAGFFALGGFGAPSSAPPLFFVALPLVVAAVFAVVGAIFFVNGVAAILMLARPPARRSVLVLLPEGVVERGGMFGGRVRAVSYADVAHAQMRVTTTTNTNANTGMSSTSVQHAIVFRHLDGRKETWRMDGSYGRPDDVISRILTAQIQYNALRGPGR